MPCSFKMATRGFFMGASLVLIDQRVYNCTVLMEVENDNIRYNQRIMRQNEYPSCGTLQMDWTDSTEF